MRVVGNKLAFCQCQSLLRQAGSSVGVSVAMAMAMAMRGRPRRVPTLNLTASGTGQNRQTSHHQSK